MYDSQACFPNGIEQFYDIQDDDRMLISREEVDTLASALFLHVMVIACDGKKWYIDPPSEKGEIVLETIDLGKTLTLQTTMGSCRISLGQSICW